MPIYEYICKLCNHEFEEARRFSDPELKKCPKCGKKSLRKKVSKSDFSLKGNCWHKDGYVSKGNTPW